MGLRRAIASGGTMAFEGYGDLSLTELLPAILTRYSETELLIAAPSLPDQAAEAVLSWMGKTWARMDGQGRLWRVAHLTVIADLSEEKSPMASQWLKENPLGDRLTLVDAVQPDTLILLPDFAVTGPVNMRYGEHFTAEATTEKEKIDALWEKYAPRKEEMPAPTSGQAQGTPVPEAPKPAGETPVDEHQAEVPDEAPSGEQKSSDRPKGKSQKKQKKDAE